MQMMQLLTASAPSEEERVRFDRYINSKSGIQRIDELGGNVLMYYFLFARPPLPEAIKFLVD
jgi:hypothetical protein